MKNSLQHDHANTCTAGDGHFMDRNDRNNHTNSILVSFTEEAIPTAWGKDYGRNKFKSTFFFFICLLFYVLFSFFFLFLNFPFKSHDSCHGNTFISKWFTKHWQDKKWQFIIFPFNKTNHGSNRSHFKAGAMIEDFLMNILDFLPRVSQKFYNILITWSTIWQLWMFLPKL